VFDVHFAVMARDWTVDHIMLAAVLVCLAAAAAAVVVGVVVWLHLHRRSKNAAELTKDKESALLVSSPATTETIRDLLSECTGSGSGQAIQLATSFIP